MNEFEKNIKHTRNDVVDAGVGFIASFGFFATIFLIATIIKIVGS
ncbi:YqzM family protein [Fredinandcohnia humi]